MSKIARVLYSEQELRGNGGIAVRCKLISPDSTDFSGRLESSEVEGLSAADVIAEGSVLITPVANYIAFADNSFGKVGEEYTGSKPDWYK